MKRATPPTDGALSPFKLNLMRSAVKGGLRDIAKTIADIVNLEHIPWGDTSSTNAATDEILSCSSSKGEQRIASEMRQNDRLFLPLQVK